MSENELKKELFIKFINTINEEYKGKFKTPDYMYFTCELNGENYLLHVNHENFLLLINVNKKNMMFFDLEVNYSHGFTEWFSVDDIINLISAVKTNKIQLRF